MSATFLVLISAHFVADFLFQPDGLRCCPKKGRALLLNAFMVAAVSYLFLQQWTAWPVPVLVLVWHALIDFIQGRRGDSWRSFCLNQLAHILCMLGIATLCLAGGWMAEFSGVGARWMLLLAGFTASVHAAGCLVGKVAAQLQSENELSGALSGLENGGKLIGQLERALIFLLILVGQPGGIGFLIAAKSILRFSEAKESQKLAEYVLIGTLLSFGLAIAAGSITVGLAKGL